MTKTRTQFLKLMPLIFFVSLILIIAYLKMCVDFFAYLDQSWVAGKIFLEGQMISFEVVNYV